MAAIETLCSSFGRNIITATIAITASATNTSGCTLERIPTIDWSPGIPVHDRCA